MNNKPLENKVAQKAILAFDPEKYLPKNQEIVFIDLKNFLYKELLLKEADYREYLKSKDFTVYRDKYVYIGCTSDAIIPMWAYMLIQSYLAPIVSGTVFANTIEEAKELFMIDIINQLDNTQFQNQRIVVKGCGTLKVSPRLYFALMQKFQPLAKAISFGEACSMVPVFKK